MHSPLPDSSALEAGILEDETPSRLSRVQDNVRALLRSSVLGSVRGTPTSSPLATGRPTDIDPHHGLPTPRESPQDRTSRRVSAASPNAPAEITTSTASSTASSPTSSTRTDSDEVQMLPPDGYRHTLLQMAHQSALFNTRAVAALNHPDLNDPSLAIFLQQKTTERQRRAWKRTRAGRRGGRKERRKRAARAGASQGVLCVIAAFLLAAVVSTYLVLASAENNMSTTFHVLFILGIILATIVFAHTLVRLLLFPNEPTTSERDVLVVATRKRHHRHRREHQHRDEERVLQSLNGNETTDFVPVTPIAVHMPADEVRPDDREAQPSAGVELEVPARNAWERHVETVKNPPPAYGRWRGSVRANPDLLHWQAIPSPVESEASGIPSPTYEEATMAHLTGPPSYATRNSPARQPQREEGLVAERQSQIAEPEMVEVRGFGLAV